MARYMYDSTNPFDIPTTAQMVAGYIDGLYAWPGAGWSRFAGKIAVRIAIDPNTNDGHVLDVENGAASPQSAPIWVEMRRAAAPDPVKGWSDPSVYCNASTLPSVRAAFQSQGVREPHYWVAAWDGNPVGYPGAVAHQYANPTLTGGHYDYSAVDDYWPGVDPPPSVPVFPPVPATGLDGAYAGWAGVADFLNRVVPSTSSELALLGGQFQGLG